MLHTGSYASTTTSRLPILRILLVVHIEKLPPPIYSFSVEPEGAYPLMLPDKIKL